MSDKYGATGKTRYRPMTSGFLIKKTVLVLQIEIRVVEYESIGGTIDSADRLIWRDAQVEDLPLP